MSTTCSDQVIGTRPAGGMIPIPRLEERALRRLGDDLFRSGHRHRRHGRCVWLSASPDGEHDHRKLARQCCARFFGSRPPLQRQRPIAERRWLPIARDQRIGGLDQYRSNIRVPALRDSPEPVDLARLVLSRRQSEMGAYGSRARKALRNINGAMKARALTYPMPGILISRRHSGRALAMAISCLSKVPI